MPPDPLSFNLLSSGQPIIGSKLWTFWFYIVVYYWCEQCSLNLITHFVQFSVECMHWVTHDDTKGHWSDYMCTFVIHLLISIYNVECILTLLVCWLCIHKISEAIFHSGWECINTKCHVWLPICHALCFQCIWKMSYKNNNALTTRALFE